MGGFGQIHCLVPVRASISWNMEPHRQACGTSCYAQTGDILSKEHSPTAKAVVLCVEG